MEARRCVTKVTNDRKEEGYTSETFLSTKNIPHRWKGGCKRSVANDREKEREDERKIDEPPKRIFLQLCMDFPVNLDETNSPWNYTWLE